MLRLQKLLTRSAALLAFAWCVSAGPLRSADEARVATTTPSGDSDGNPANSERYLLRYKFRAGEEIRWHIEHRAEIRTTIGGTTQTAETWSDSTKVWRVTSVEPSGQATFEHLVESVQMRQKLTGRQEVTYNSDVDLNPPAGFEQVASSIGVPLTEFTVDSRGTIIRREEKRAQATNNPGQITISLPEEEIAVGHTWSFPYEVEVTLKDGQVKQIQTRQVFKLLDVASGVARIEVGTQVLTPVHDPAVEAQLVQRESSGTVRFDIEQGRIVGQQMDLDRNVVGYAGEGSSLRYLTRFNEDLLTGPRTAKRSAAGPDLPPGLGGASKAAPAAQTAGRRLNSVRR